jgi:hypothetical protein
MRRWKGRGTAGSAPSGPRVAAPVTRFVVHIGPHKTGTTYIQETLAALRGTLEERGISIPSVWDAAPGSPSHMQIACAIRRGDVAAVQAQMRDILAGRPEVVVISCEALSRFDPGQVLELRRLLGAAPAQVVYYVRRPPERLPSLWQETVKHGHAMTLPDFIAGELRQHDAFAGWDTAVLDRFSAVFGPEAVKVVSYSHLEDNGIDIARHFLAAFVDPGDFALPAMGRPNGSLAAPDIELIRALNAINARHGGETSAALRNWFLTRKDALVPPSLLERMRANMGSIHLDERLPPLALPPRHVLARYGASLVPPWKHATLHEPRIIDAPFVRPGYLADPATMQLLDGIYATYRSSVIRA